MKILTIRIILIVFAVLTLVLIIKRESIADFFVSADDTASTTKMEKKHNTSEEVKPFYQGEVVNAEHGGAYSYVEVKEKTEKTFWIVVDRTDVEIGDYVRFQKELVTKNFTSKALNRTFDEIMFASNLQHKVKE